MQGRIFRLNSSRIGTALCATILAGLAVAVYWNARNAPFFFDDHAAILENWTIRDLQNLVAVLNPPATGSGVTGRPLVNASLALNYAWSGTSVRGYHLTNVGLHLAAALLLFGAIRRTLRIAPTLAFLRGSATVFALSIAALSVSHPLQTESVTCIIQRTEVLVSVFYLLCLYAFIRYTEGSSKGWGFTAVAAAFAGMASKEVMVSAPVLVFLYDRAFVAGSFREAWSLRKQLHLGIAASWLLLAFLVLGMGGTRGEAAGFGLGAASWTYALKQCEAIILYLKLTFWPHPLVVFYGTDVISDPRAVWPQIFVLSGLLLASGYAWWRNSPWGFLGAWFFAILAPSSSIVPLVTQTVSEHRMYLAIVAPLIAVVAGVWRCGGHRGLATIVPAVLAFALLSSSRNRDYRSDLSIWNDTVAKVPTNARARVNLGAALKAVGQLEAARAQFEAASSLDPSNVEALNNLATLAIETGKPGNAVALCRAALELRPKFALAHNNLGLALFQLGAVDQAIPHLRQALSLRREFPEAHTNLAAALLATGDVSGARSHAATAVRLRPSLAMAHFQLGNAFFRENEVSAAQNAWEQALRLDPNFAAAHSNLGGLYYRGGDISRAVQHFLAAVRAEPGFVDARNNLASGYAQLGRTEEAIAEYEALLRLNPDYLDAYLNLSGVLFRTGRTAAARDVIGRGLQRRPNEPQLQRALADLNALKR